MNAVDHEQLKDIIRDIVGQSHQAIAAVQSNSVAEIKTSLAVIENKLDNIQNYQKIQNGNVAKAVLNIEEDRKKIDTLNQESIEVKSSFRTFKWVSAIASAIVLTLIGTISGLVVRDYNLRNTALAKDTDQVKSTLEAYQLKTDDTYKQMIELLKDISKKR